MDMLNLSNGPIKLYLRVALDVTITLLIKTVVVRRHLALQNCAISYLARI
jgi:hypothetical protein